jgi:low affinity Fe/Cu permease
MAHRGSLFDRFAKHVSRFAGHPVAFAAAAFLILPWLVGGPPRRAVRGEA